MVTPHRVQIYKPSGSAQILGNARKSRQKSTERPIPDLWVPTTAGTGHIQTAFMLGRLSEEHWMVMR